MTSIRQHVWRASATVLILALLTTPLGAQDPVVVYDPWSVAQSIIEVINLVRQYTEMIRQAQRLPVDLANRYRGQSVAWTLQDIASLYAQPLLNALNIGDPTGRAYQQIVQAIDVPTDILARMPPELQQRLRTVYATIELADGIAKRGIDQVGATRAIGAPVLQTIRIMEQDAASTLDAFNTEAALLNKINTASVLGLRLADQSNQFLLNTVEQLLVDTTRKRDTEAAVVGATIYQWRYGQAYGTDLFRNSATDMDTWRMR
ncbi:MAG: hypothetical protein ABJA98_20695 [Acidobacteriota bacterium]